MASTYTNGGIEKIGSGEQAGTWGNTTNNNLDIIDKSINGVQSITLSGGSSTKTVTDGTVSDAGAKVLVLSGTPGETHTLTLAPNDADKVHLVQNGTNQTVNISQGSGANAVLVAGEIAWIFCDGAGSSAAVTKQVIDSISASGDFSVGDDLSLISDAAVLKFGADSEITMTHVADQGLTLKNTNTGDDKPVIFTLQTGETDMAAGEALGEIRFQAPDEGTGTDAILVAAAISARAEGDFSSSSNATKLSFQTGSSEAASEKMSLSSGGDLTVSNNIVLNSDSAVISFGADADVTITHNADDGITLKSSATADDNPTILTLQTGETDIAANDVLGVVQFQAPDEASGTDANLVAASVSAISEGDFAADNNATKLSFAVGASEVATEKMSLSSGGNLTVSGTITGNSFVGVDDIGMSAKVTVGSSTPALTASVNVTSVSDNGTGDFTINIDTNYLNDHYAATITTFDNDGTNRNVGDNTVHAQAAGTLQIKTYRATPSEVSVRGSFDPDGFFVMSNAQTPT
tara:strand:- start:54 stop:1613 length:1560 start_codon:yes stop_codon:yes gene_type:complete